MILITDSVMVHSEVVGANHRRRRSGASPYVKQTKSNLSTGWLIAALDGDHLLAATAKGAVIVTPYHENEVYLKLGEPTQETIDQFITKEELAILSANTLPALSGAYPEEVVYFIDRWQGRFDWASNIHLPRVTRSESIQQLYHSENDLYLNVLDGEIVSIEEGRGIYKCKPDTKVFCHTAHSRFIMELTLPRPATMKDLKGLPLLLSLAKIADKDYVDILKDVLARYNSDC